MAKEFEINLSLGLKPFKINFEEFDEPVMIMFNPADADIPKRLFEAQKRIEEGKEKIGNFELDENGLPKVDEYIDSVTQLNNLVFDAVDYAFGNKISDKLFKHCSPFAVTNGQYFIMQFFEKITPVMQKIIESEKGKANENTQKYLSKYKKK